MPPRTKQGMHGFKIINLRSHVGKPCPYCGTIMVDDIRSWFRPTKDHEYPKRLRNQRRHKHRFKITVCCDWCNHHKADRYKGEFLRWLAWVMEGWRYPNKG